LLGNWSTIMARTLEKLEAINARLGALFKAERQTMTAFKGLLESASRPGKLSPAVKEMAAVAIAAAKGCDDCIVYHVAAAKRHGANREELSEMLAVAVEMAGGPGAVYAAKALEAFDDLI
jgi:AhpD family alkylhydroperoxidase